MLYGLIPILPTELHYEGSTWVFRCEFNGFKLVHHSDVPWGKWSDYGLTVSPA